MGAQGETARRAGGWLALGLAATLLAGCGSSDDSAVGGGGGAVDPGTRGATVPRPAVTGPLSGGVRTGEPFGTTMVPLLDGYVEEEFLIAGNARGHGAAAGTEAPYATRILVRRPQEAADFNGTVVLDWNNVTLQMDIESTWAAANDVLMQRGFIYVGVSAQKQGVDGSPLGIYFWDPVRYAGASHPDDDYSWDIFSQAGMAIFDPAVLPDALRARIARVVATGSSQSAGRLNTYINEIHARDQVFDGFMPQIAGAATTVRKDLVPVLWINSQDEAAGISEPPADTPLFRYWEVVGPPHTTNAGEQYIVAIATYNHATNGLVNPYDPESAGQYGELDARGSCNRNRYPTRYVWSAGIVALHTWLISGSPPTSVPPIARDSAGELSFDEFGNALGGFRLPVVDVPIAAYYAGTLPPAETLTPCAPGGSIPLVGTSQTFTPLQLMALYPTHGDYVAQLEAATAEAVAAGRLLPEHAEDLLRRARGADVTDPLGLGLP